MSISPKEAIEPIDYNLMPEPPPWFQKKAKVETEKPLDFNIPPSDETQLALSKVEKIAFYTIAGLIASFGVVLFSLGIITSIPLAGAVLLCGIGVFFILAAGAAFEQAYHIPTLESV